MSDLIHYVHENEEVKLKLASLMEEAKANIEEIVYLRVKIVAHEEECCAS